MIFKYIKTLKDGRRHVLIELAKGESMPEPAIDSDAYYKLGYPVDDIINGHIIKELQRVYWDSLEQKWIDA